MLLGNIPHEIMGFDALADNKSSAEFPDDDEELFNLNEFNDLNEYTDPDMGLNFNPRQD